MGCHCFPCTPLSPLPTPTAGKGPWGRGLHPVLPAPGHLQPGGSHACPAAGRALAPWTRDPGWPAAAPRAAGSGQKHFHAHGAPWGIPVADDHRSSTGRSGRYKSGNLQGNTCDPGSSRGRACWALQSTRRAGPPKRGCDRGCGTRCPPGVPESREGSLRRASAAGGGQPWGRACPAVGWPSSSRDVPSVTGTQSYAL